MGRRLGRRCRSGRGRGGPSGKTGWEALDKWVGGAAPAAAAAAPSGKTGWEALDKWVGGSGGGAAPAAAAAAPSGKTGWEALDKWVGDGSGAPAGETNGHAAPAAEPVPAGSTGAAPPSGGGLMGFLKRLFGSK